MLRNQARVLRDSSESDSAPSTTFIAAYMESLEQWISFDLDDDIEFCPNLVSENDVSTPPLQRINWLDLAEPNLFPCSDGLIELWL